MINFWQLPDNRNYVLLSDDFKRNIIETLKTKKVQYKIMRKLKRNKLKIKTIKEISKILGMNLKIFEEKILWVGALNSRGLSNPRLPFNLSSRVGARFIAAIINDGSLTKEGKETYGRLMYDNFDKDLRNSIIDDYLAIFGGKTNEIAFRNYEKKKYLEFSSIIRDIIYLIIKTKGPKSESNLNIPNLIFNNKENMLGWIEQTIADEGNVNYNPDKYRREIVWRRSLDVSSLFNKFIDKEIPFRKLSSNTQKLLYKQKCKLIESEKKILDAFWINYREYNLGVYPTKKGKIKTRWQISVTKRENLIKLRELIKIPSKIKDKKFSKMCKEFQRYKEPLKIREAIIKLGKNKKTFTPTDLKLKMRYKNTNTTYKWLNISEKEGLIKKVKNSTYGKGYYRKPAQYRLNL